MTATLRLRTIPKAETVRLTITLSTKLRTDLDGYAEPHAQRWDGLIDGRKGTCGTVPEN
jgi:hypothetical protein